MRKFPLPASRQWPAILSLALLWLLGAALVWPALSLLLGTLAPHGEAGYDHLRSAWAASVRWLVLAGNSLGVALGTVLIAGLLGGPLAFLVFRADLPGRRIWGWLALVAAGIPLYVTATCWLALHGGAFWFTLSHPLAKLLAVAWLQGVAMAPLAVWLVGLALSAVDPALEDSARVDYGNWGTLWRITLPGARRGLLLGALLLGLLTAGDISITDLVLLRTLPEETYTQFQHQANAWSAAALTLPLLLFMALACWLGARLLAGGAWNPAGLARGARTWELGRWRWPLAGLAGGGTALLVAWPLGALLRATGGLREAWAKAGAALPELGVSLATALPAATLSMALGLAGAWVWRRGGWPRRLVAGSALLLLATPPPLYGIALIEVLNHPDWRGAIYDSPAVLIWSGAARAWPFALALILPGVLRLPRGLEDQALLEGAGWWTRLWRLWLPLCRPWWVAAWLLSFILAVSEVGAATLISPPGMNTLAIRFFTLIHFGVYTDAATLCVLLMLLAGLPAAGLAWLATRRGAGG